MTAKTEAKGASFSRVRRKEENYTSGEDAITYEQVQRLLSRTGISLVDEALLRLVFDGGLRRVDIVNVRCANVDMRENHLIYWEQKKRRNWQCYLEPSTIKTLSQLMASSGSEWVFPGANPKKHLSDRTAYNILQENLKACGIDSRPFHAMRSTCIKLKQLAGWPVEMTAKHIGDSIKVVQTHYLTPSQEEMRAKVRETNLFGESKKGGAV